MHEYGVVPSPLLYLGHLSDDSCDGTQVGALTVWSPALNVDLLHLVTLVRLRQRRKHIEAKLHKLCHISDCRLSDIQ